MSNTVLKSKFSIFSSLGMIPKTSVLEEKENKLRKEYIDFNEYKESDELAHYKELDAFINSPDFEKTKREINSLKYADSEEYRKEKDYNQQKKSKKIKTYYQVKDSKELIQFQEFSKSEKLANYEDLSRFFLSNDFEEFKKSIGQQKNDKLNDIKNKQNGYKELNKKFKWFFTFKNSKQLADYNTFISSKEYDAFLDLENLVKSTDFDALKRDIENQKKQKLDEFNSIKSRYNELKALSKKVKKGEEFDLNDEFKELEQVIKSNEHVQAIKNLKIENLDEYKKQKEYQKQLKTQAIKNYNKIKDSENLKKFGELDGSKEIEEYLELEKEIQSNEFKTSIQEAKNLKFENTEEYKKFQEFKSLKKSSDIKQYYKFQESEKLAIYKELNDSQEISDFEELEKYIQSDEFKERKQYLLIKDKFKLSEEYKQQQEYIALKKSDKIKWFFKLEKSYPFSEIENWELTFDDDFNDKNLDQDKWLTGYYYGKTLLNDNYVQANEKQFFTDKNLEIKDSILRITTKFEKVKGKAWNPSMGFYPKEFDFTSGLINSGQSFRQKQGLFKAKIKVNHSYPVHHAFWMLGEKITPEIDIFKYDKKSKKKLSIASYWGNPSNDKEIKKERSSISGPDFSSDYYIYSLEWTPEKLIWKINDIPVFVQTEGLPDEPMYLLLSSGIAVDGVQANLPCTMEVDWIRVYQKK
ncbi:MAG: hypothetical protein A2X13_12670 [Bacteroidetes bacterium GWC2_33_15]|nr:MAG: hypothetical protein A2X10_14025 [Bacteroidetes bacterium GWA2_33_15]OFX50640.1 MAG: hypothetical protein A2X13_12670 [Bacteroidetes bacterium GWC2_33_15]OFX63264.1 MAG: hypothetical protein A2X15_02130 [Bacteroidetes bacterium GWB2_32_14]OFX69789.1 MAG: hypothetical protein A2X14_05345 [Bacteroidetes bacterium GWD2_33_33]HAN19829.1 hypothetical protein [Bacteroidales bacterium]